MINTIAIVRALVILGIFACFLASANNSIGSVFLIFVPLLTITGITIFILALAKK